jgi:hypothetical protein
VIIIYEPGDPVRLAGRRGLWRFVEYETPYVLSGLEDYANATEASVIGPIGKSERLYTVPVTDLVQPPKTATRDDVAMHPGVASLSHTAKTSGRRR